MRLLNTATLKLGKNIGIPNRFAVLSHTWGNEEDEVSFHDLTSDNYTHLPGYEKIKRACAVARAEGYETIWIDTCCIDKSSSAELSEAINSVFNIYAAASICYAYLSDVGERSPTDDSLVNNENTRTKWPDGSLEASRWFR